MQINGPLRKTGRPSKPVLPAVFALRGYIGLAGEAIDMIEFCIRDVEVRAGETCDGDMREYVKLRKSVVKNISSSPADWGRMRVTATTSYVLEVHVAVERFLDELARDVTRFRGNDESRNPSGQTEQLSTDTETKDSLDRVLDTIGTKRVKELRKTFEYDLLQYYRYLRNRVMHVGSKKPLSTMQETIVAKHKATITSDYPGFVAPNKINSLTFDDFRVYSRACLRLAYWLNDAIALTADEIINHERKIGILRSSWLKLKGKGTSWLKESLRAELARKYESSDRQLFDLVATELAADVMATGRAKDRKKERRRTAAPRLRSATKVREVRAWKSRPAQEA
jgi:hypothetical protein